MSKKTVGEISLELSQKSPESRDPIELQREMQKEYVDNLVECVRNFKETTTADFYIMVITKNERLMTNVFRNYFSGRLSCPTPDYDQALYRYKSKEQCIEFVWVIPSKDTCIHLLENSNIVAEEERELLQYVIDFKDGSLYALAKKLNGESKGSPFIE